MMIVFASPTGRPENSRGGAQQLHAQLTDLKSELAALLNEISHATLHEEPALCPDLQRALSALQRANTALRSVARHEARRHLRSALANI